MNLHVNYKINKLPEVYVKDRSLRRPRGSPSPGVRNARSFKILKKAEKTAVLLVSPETSRLPESMGDLARYISGKAGGLGEVVSTLCEGLRARGVECHLATLNLKKRFQRDNNVDESAWREIRYTVDPDRVHLVSSSIFANLSCAYAGNPLLNAAEYQKQVVNNIIKTVRAKNGGRLILHSHDWMAGGVVTAYAKARGCPVLHTVHNVHTGHIPVDMLFGVDVDSLAWNIYFSKEYGRRCIDSQATAIKSATIVNFVGEKFLKEVIEDYFLDRSFIPPSVRQEVKAKHYHGAALSIMNATSPRLYPENCEYLVRKYDHDNDVVAAKRDNLIEFQKRTGLVINPQAILLYWPSRLDETQKGVELLEDIALKFVIENGDVQIAVVGNGVEGDRTHEENMGRIACASRGKITYQRFSEGLSMLGYAAASDVFGASLYEPCGQIDQLGNLFGTTATNRDTGGYHDKIEELRLKDDGAIEDQGNGFLFQSYDPGGLWYGLSKSVQFHRRSLETRECQIKRIMRKARKKYDLDTMVDAYVRVYENLKGGPLF
ncbi:MAG: glycogen/starch synthase [Syntrophaceae bacterium]